MNDWLAIVAQRWLVTSQTVNLAEKVWSELSGKLQPNPNLRLADMFEVWIMKPSYDKYYNSKPSDTNVDRKKRNLI